MKLVGLVRLGRDAEIRHAANGDAVAGFSGAFNYGRKGDDGRRPSQWVDFALWGKRAESLAPYLKKGAQVEVFASDVHIETFDKKDGSTGFRLVARVDDLELAGSRDDAAPAPSRPAAAPSKASSLAEMEDDIPF